MTATFAVRDAVKLLTRDPLRASTDFTRDMKAVHRVVWDHFPDEAKQKEALTLWMHKKQPCVFGKAAAALDMMHIVLIRHEDLLHSDQHIEGLIREGLLAWKRRSLEPAGAHSRPAHGLVLAVVSGVVANAAPNAALQVLAERVRELWGCAAETHVLAGERRMETLYLRHPRTREYFRFTFSIDFFAAQGDGRWWHDHRFPGGIAFTANSVGHMRAYRDWYERREGQDDWILRTAMKTIAGAKPTEWGPATWLVPLADGRPIVHDVARPSDHANFVNGELAEKDWTRYRGYLHTDHDIRPIFFRESAELPREVAENPYLLDFMYLYRTKEADHAKFTQGELVTQDEVYAAIGHPEAWPSVVSERPRRTPGLREELEAAAPAVASGALDETWEDALEECRSWRLSEEEARRLYEI